MYRLWTSRNALYDMSGKNVITDSGRWLLAFVTCSKLYKTVARGKHSRGQRRNVKTRDRLGSQIGIGRETRRRREGEIEALRIVLAFHALLGVCNPPDSD